MKLLFVVPALLIAVVGASNVPAAIVGILPAIQHSSQYHSQDSLGQYSYGYADGLSAKNEVRSADGQTVGSYSYLDAEGKIQNVHYRADPLHGFRAFGSIIPKNEPLVLPELVRETPEVIEARTRHLEALRLAEESAKKSAEALRPEVKSAIHAHPAIVTAPSATSVVRSIPAFGYSFAINYGAYSPHIISTYADPGHIIRAPLLKEPNFVATAELNREHSGVVAAREVKGSEMLSAKN